MQNFRVIFSNFAQNDPRFGGVYRQFSGRPSWIYKAAFAAAAIVILVPALLILLAAIFAFSVVFLVGTLIHRITGGLEGLFAPKPRRDEVVRASDFDAAAGRRNVRVIYPEQQ